jgi:hypothetical protein
MEDFIMQEIIIDEHFKYLLPELSEADFQKLEISIIEYGCVVPLILWNRILIDGYHRYKICSKHDIPFKIVEMEFDSREEATIWIIDNQISRRNLTPIQLCYFRGLHYHLEKQLIGGDRKSTRQKSLYQNDTMISGGTAGALAELYNVSRPTIIRDEKLAIGLNRVNDVLPEAKMKILSEEVSVNKSKLETFAEAPLEKVTAFANEVVDGTYDRKAQSSAKREVINNIIEIFPEVQELTTLVNNFTKDIGLLMLNMNKTGPVEAKSALRIYIDTLEDFYGGWNIV